MSKKVARIREKDGYDVAVTVEGGRLFFIWAGGNGYVPPLESLGSLPLKVARWAAKEVGVSQTVVGWGDEVPHYPVRAHKNRIRIGCCSFLKGDVLKAFEALGI